MGNLNMFKNLVNSKIRIIEAMVVHKMIYRSKETKIRCVMAVVHNIVAILRKRITSQTI